MRLRTLGTDWFHGLVALVLSVLLLAFVLALVPLMAPDPGVLDVALAMAVIEAAMLLLVAWQLRRGHAGAIRIGRLSRQVVRP